MKRWRPRLRLRFGCALRHPVMYRFGAPIFVIDGISLLSYISLRKAHERHPGSPYSFCDLVYQSFIFRSPFTRTLHLSFRVLATRPIGAL